MKIDSAVEAEWLDGARKYHHETLTAIYDCYSPEIYAYSLRLLSEPDLAEECTAETFSRFLQALRGGHCPREYLRAYLYRIAHNWITDRYRRQPPLPLELDENLRADEEELPQQVASRRFAQARMRAALSRLSPDQRQVIVLRYLEEWEMEEISAALHKSVGAVKALQHRALEALRVIMVGEDA